METHAFMEDHEIGLTMVGNIFKKINVDTPANSLRDVL